MVLKSGPSKAKIWGWGPAPSTPVVVILSDETNVPVQLHTGLTSGVAPFAWEVELDPVQASNAPFSLKVMAGAQTEAFDNILFGEGTPRSNHDDA
jgi:pyruvate/oxaloacetate carboxyltransferase